MKPELLNKLISQALNLSPICDGYCVAATNENSIAFSSQSKKECEEWLANLPESSIYKYYAVQDRGRYRDFAGDSNELRVAFAELTDAEMSNFVEQSLARIGGMEINNFVFEPGSCEIASVLKAQPEQLAEVLLDVIGDRILK